jgi:DNA repair protein RecN (Recombination protein N)
VLEQLRIKNLGVIRDAVLDFSPGLTVLTGETGAGKTMVFRSLALLFGGKSDSSLISTGAEQALVEADVVVPDRLIAQLTELGSEFDQGNLLILSRQVNSGGRSRAFAGGISIPAGTISDLGDELIAVHGQSDQIRLTKGDQQRLLLDRFGAGAVAKALDNYRNTWDQRKLIKNRLDSLNTDAGTRAAELERLTRILDQVNLLKPQPKEDLELADEASRLSHSEALYAASNAAISGLTGSQNDSERANVAQALSALRKVIEHEQSLDPKLEEFVTRIRELEVLVADLAADFAAYSGAIDASPQRLAYVEDRRAALKALAREFGQVDDLLAWVAENKLRQAELAGGDEIISELEAQLAKLTAQLKTEASVLTKERAKAAANFAKAVSAELDGLAMTGAKVEFVLTEAKLGPTGADDIALGLSSRPGAPLIAVAKGASGGELSRIMLAVEVVLAAADPIETFVFDEVDAGVGGAAAVEVGKRLAQLAKSSQVIVVTHLPQVAAFADKHLVISRLDGDEFHKSAVSEVTDSDRVTELSRMLAGLSDSVAGTKLAEELLSLAKSVK